LESQSKKSGDLIAYLLDEPTVLAIAKWKKLDSAWRPFLAQNEIPAASDHSRFVEFEKHVLLFEADHPGWIQILQSKESELLDDYQYSFPKLGIVGISFRLSREPIVKVQQPVKTQSSQDDEAPPPLSDSLSTEERLNISLERIEEGIRKWIKHGR
jgi:hypothetical protein